MTEFSLRVLTINIWGLHGPWPIGSSDLKNRLRKLAEELSSGAYDLVALQELWAVADYDFLRKETASVLPYGHYFHSGCVGSGVAALSRFPIREATMHRYSLNGFAHHVHRGDWFGGKVVGLLCALVKVHPDHRPVLVNFYTTHIHAEYNSKKDLYLTHRVVQSYELSQFVKHTSQLADVCILTGDMNMEPTGLGYKLVTANAGLRDAWAEFARGRNLCAGEGMTCERPDNYYTPRSALRHCPHGKRLDYILFKTGHSGVSVTVKSCDVRLKSLPNSDASLADSNTSADENCSGGNMRMPCYSDHAAVYAEFCIKRNFDAVTPIIGRFTESADGDVWPNSDVTVRPMLQEAVSLIEKCERRVRSDRRVFMVALAVLAILYVCTVHVELVYASLTVPAMLLRFLFTILMAFCLWYGLIGLKLEEKALTAAKAGMRLNICTFDEVPPSGAALSKEPPSSGQNVA